MCPVASGASVSNINGLPRRPLRRILITGLGQQLPDDLRLLAIGQGGIGPIALVDELGVIEPEAVQEGGVQVVMMHHVFDRMMAPFIRLAMHIALPETAAGKPVGKPERIMVPAPLFPPGVILQNG